MRERSFAQTWSMCKSEMYILADKFIVLKQVHPDTGISNRAMSILNSFVNGELALIF